MSQWKGRLGLSPLDGSRPDKASFLLETKVHAAESIGFRSDALCISGRRTREDVGGGEGAKFCQFRLNGNPRDFLCSPPLFPSCIR